MACNAATSSIVICFWFLKFQFILVITIYNLGLVFLFKVNLTKKNKIKKNIFHKSFCVFTPICKYII